MKGLRRIFSAEEIASWFIVRNDTEIYIKENASFVECVYISSLGKLDIQYIKILLYITQKYAIHILKKPIFIPLFPLLNKKFENRTFSLTPNKEDVNNFLDVEWNEEVNFFLEKIYRQFTSFDISELRSVINYCLHGVKLDKNYLSIITKKDLNDLPILDKIKTYEFLDEKTLFEYSDHRAWIRHFCIPKERIENLMMFLCDDSYEETFDAQEWLKMLEEHEDKKKLNKIKVYGINYYYKKDFDMNKKVIRELVKHSQILYLDDTEYCVSYLNGKLDIW